MTSEPHQLDSESRPRLKSLGYYVGSITTTIIVLVLGLRLGETDLHAPFRYELDALLILPLVKATVERGSHWRNERLGAPGIQELHDFPIVDHLHFGIIWLIGQIIPEPVLVFNLYYLLGYPFGTVTAQFSLRRLGFRRESSFLGGLLFAFQPYHYYRGVMHYFLSAYFVIPLTLLSFFWVCRGTLPFFPIAQSGLRTFTLRDRRGAISLVVAVLTASAGAYYAFFACALGAATGVYAWVAHGTWRALASALLIVAGIAVFGVLNHAPTFGYQSRFGQNSRPHTRLAEEADIYGMKLAHLVLPVPDHQSSALARVRAAYDSPHFRPLQNENTFDALGLIPSLGLIGLLVASFLPQPRRFPIGPAAALALFAVLLSTIGGVGSIFNHLITPQVRAYNRISIYLAFLALIAVCWVLDRLGDRLPTWTLRGRWKFPTRLLLALGLSGFGLWDQLNTDWFWFTKENETRAKHITQYWQDREFFQQVEEQLTPGSAVFCYPHLPYPEGVPLAGLESYEHVRGYLHTRTTRWSFGAMNGREWDTRGRDLMNETPPRFFERLVLLGFRGILINTRGLGVKNYQELVQELERVAGSVVPISHPGGDLHFVNLSAYAESLQSAYGQSSYQKLVQKEFDQISTLWLKGFLTSEPLGKEWRLHLAPKRAQLVLVNPTERIRKVRIEAEFALLIRGPTPLMLSGAGWTDHLSISNDFQAYSRELELLPGHTKIWITTEEPAHYVPTDSRRLLVLVKNYRLTELSE